MEYKQRIPHLFSKVDNIHIHFLFFQALCHFDKLQDQQVGTETGRDEEKIQAYIDSRRVC